MVAGMERRGVSTVNCPAMAIGGSLDDGRGGIVSNQGDGVIEGNAGGWAAGNVRWGTFRIHRLMIPLADEARKSRDPSTASVLRVREALTSLRMTTRLYAGEHQLITGNWRLPFHAMLRKTLTFRYH